jgi:hypothetical protein
MPLHHASVERIKKIMLSKPTVSLNTKRGRVSIYAVNVGL